MPQDFLVIFEDDSTMEVEADDKFDAAILASGHKVLSNPTRKNIKGDKDPSTWVKDVYPAEGATA